jgi:hypothetical protein
VSLGQCGKRCTLAQQASASERQRPTEGKDEQPGLQGIRERAARIRDKLTMEPCLRDGD